MSSPIVRISPVNRRQMGASSPFVHCEYMRDLFPPGDELMQPPNRGSGNDYDMSQPYRMYYGDNAPGFPQHPHRGFETITIALEGFIDHSDSLGNGWGYGNGVLQWLTAGRGIVHGENFPLLNRDKSNPLRVLVIWLNMPSKNKMVDPYFAMVFLYISLCYV